MSTKLFSPSLDLRREPPNTKGVVLFVRDGSCVVNFRGKQYPARIVDDGIAVGDSVSFVECPRGVYHVRRNGPSWYANPIENWVKAKKRACAALEYLLRKCRKWYPFMTASDGTLIELPPDMGDEGFGTDAGFDALDGNDDGFITIDEWLAAGGDESTFRQLDQDGDGRIDRDEWRRGTHRGGSGKMAGNGLGTGTGGSTGGETGGETGGGSTGGGGAPLGGANGWEPYGGDMSTPPDFTPGDENIWWAILYNCLGGATGYVQHKNAGDGYSITDPYTLPDVGYGSYYGTPEMTVLHKVVAGSPFPTIYVRGTSGTSSDKTTFKRLLFLGAGGSLSMPQPSWQQWMVDAYNQAALDATTAAAADVALHTGRNERFVLVQNGAPPQICAISWSIVDLGNGTYRNIHAVGTVSI